MEITTIVLIPKRAMEKKDI
ncbi:uncharacterized protein G2W53_035165 [Senna tora]|uniref:Uncharacterized protein n=1 Tax=Senna tora TaxID=362788 RepID=A0A834SRD1_9FABA|nr:uncharacterized protein G2W53_035165 [Senna tora]